MDNCLLHRPVISSNVCSYAKLRQVRADSDKVTRLLHSLHGGVFIACQGQRTNLKSTNLRYSPPSSVDKENKLVQPTSSATKAVYIGIMTCGKTVNNLNMTRLTTEAFVQLWHICNSGKPGLIRDDDV